MGVRSVHCDAQIEAVHACMRQRERETERERERERETETEREGKRQRQKGREERERERETDRERERERAFIRSVLHNGGSRTVTLARDYTCVHTH